MGKLSRCLLKLSRAFVTVLASAIQENPSLSEPPANFAVSPPMRAEAQDFVSEPRRNTC
jgi:hypothetical protein